MARSQSFAKIIFITTGYPTHYRPHECIFIHRSIKMLADQIEPLVIHLRALIPGRPLVERRVWDGIEVLSVSCPQLPSGSYSHLNTELLEKLSYQLIKNELLHADIIHAADAYPSGFIAGMWATKAHKPFSFTVSGSDLNLFLKKNYSLLNRKWLSNLRGVACNSENIKHDLFQLMDGLTNTRTIYRGVDTEVFSPDGEKVGPQADLLPVRFVYFGGIHSFDPENSLFNLKGGSTLLETWKTIDGLDLPASLVFGGPGNYSEQLDAWQVSLRHPERFFCVNTISPSDIPGYIRAADVVIIPSLSEGLPNLLREAQACARPVIGSNVGGIPEAIVHGQTGWLVSPNNPYELADKIEWFCNDQEQIKIMGGKGRERMKLFFSWTTYKQQMTAFFESISK